MASATCPATRARPAAFASHAAGRAPCKAAARRPVSAAAAGGAAAAGSPEAPTFSELQPAASLTRRQLLSATAAGAATVAAVGSGIVAAGGPVAPPAAEALELAPLGRVERVGGDKLVGLSAEEVKSILARNLGEGMYFVTGDLTPEIFDDQCVFKDPTNETKGLSRYVKALGLLFDASVSAVQLKDIQVTGPRTIEATWLMGGYLKFPWHPRVEPFEGRTIYQLNEQGLIELQDQTWSITGATALAETFTPTPGVKPDIKQQLSSA